MKSLVLVILGRGFCFVELSMQIHEILLSKYNLLLCTIEIKIQLMNKLVILACMCLGMFNYINAQTQMQYQLNQQGNGDCPGSTVTLSVSTSVNITTSAVSEITSNAATTGGNISNDGGNPVSQRGVCWSTSPNPTTTDNVTNNGNGLGSFTSNLSGLTANTTYYIRSYAVNSAGIFYGNELSFVSNIGSSQYPPGTIHCNDIPTEVVEIINPITGKIWMDRNLGVTELNENSNNANALGDLYQWGRFADGHQCRISNTTENLSSLLQPGHDDFILSPNPPFDWLSPQNENLWQGRDGINNPCPIGYRLPTEQEFREELASWVSDIGNCFIDIRQCGRRNNANGFINNQLGAYWTSDIDGLNARRMGFFIEEDKFIFTSAERARGSSVRCIKDEGISENPAENISFGEFSVEGTLEEGSFTTNVSINFPYTQAIGQSFAAQSINSTGVLGLTANLTAGNFANGDGTLVYTINGTPLSSGLANFFLNIGGQNRMVSCIVNNSESTMYTDHTCNADSVHNSNLNYGSITDQEGNVYKTIIIGNKEWMAENLNSSLYSNGEPIQHVTLNAQWDTNTTGAWCYYNNDSQYACPFGKLYNWYAVANPLNICPLNWHVPSDLEWTDLSDYLGGVTVAGAKMKSEGTQFWLAPNSLATNENGFAGLPGGSRNQFSFGPFSFAGIFGFWWTSSVPILPDSPYRSLEYNDGKLYESTANKNNGFSVRCVRDL
jgi:uncharacterized protein (TIGR02145 family)